jgi:hypothetical protein
VLLPFAALLFNILTPSLLFSLARNPWRLFRLRWLGRNVWRRTLRVCVVRSEGCVEILGVRVGIVAVGRVNCGREERVVEEEADEGKIGRWEGVRRENGLWCGLVWGLARDWMGGVGG